MPSASGIHSLSASRPPQPLSPPFLLRTGTPKLYPFSPLCVPPFPPVLLLPSPPAHWHAAGVEGTEWLLGGSARYGEMRKLAELMPKSADCHIQSCSPGSEKIWSR